MIKLLAVEFLFPTRKDTRVVVLMALEVYDYPWSRFWKSELISFLVFVQCWMVEYIFCWSLFWIYDDRERTWHQLIYNKHLLNINQLLPTNISWNFISFSDLRFWYRLAFLIQGTRSLHPKMTEDHPFPILDVIIENLYLSQGHRSGASCYRKGPGMIVTPSLEGTKARVAYGRGIVQNSTCSIGQKLKENGGINTSQIEANTDSSSKRGNLNSTSNGLHDKRVCTKDYRENGKQSKLERSTSHTEHMTFDGSSAKNCCRHGVPCAPTRRSLDDAIMLQSSRNCRVQKCEELMTNFGSDNCYSGACACCGRSNSVINNGCSHESQTGSGRQHGNGIQHCHPERGKRNDGCCSSCEKTDLVTSDSGLASMQEGIDKEQKEFMEGSFGNLQDALTCWWRYAAIAQLLPPW